MSETLMNIGIKGFFKFSIFKGEYVYDLEGEHITGEDGRLIVHVTSKRTTAWKPNVILDSGKNGMAQNTVFHGQGAWCHVGNGDTLPTQSDTALETFVASTNSIQNNVFGAQAAEPWYGFRRTTYRFAEGIAAGNLNEAGVGWGSTGSTIICRHRIVDLSDIPITLSVQADEWLDVTYELRYYPPLADINQNNVDIDGVLYNVITRASRVNGATEWGERIGLEMSEHSSFLIDWQAYDGNIGLITQAPTGTPAPCDNFDQQNQAYSNDTFQRLVFSDTGPTGWNLVGGEIRSLRIMTTAGEFQSQYNQVVGDEGIPKTVNETMQMKWTIGWTEQVIV